MEGREAINKYRDYIYKEFKKCVKDLTADEIIHFADTLIQMGVYAYNDPTDPHIFELREKELLVKYRYKMKYFILSHFTNFLFKDMTHFEKACGEAGINPNDLRAELENGNIFIEVTGLFDSIKTILYINNPSDKEASPDKIELETDKLIERATPAVGRKNGITTARQVLALYYLFKAMGIRMRTDINLSVMAKFLHLLLGWDYGNINNSQLYKYLKLAPKIREDKKHLKEDLHWVKTQFESVNFEIAAKLVEDELKSLP